MRVLTHSGKPNCDGCRLANMLKHFSFAVVSNVMSDLKVAEGSCNKNEHFQ